MDNKDKLKDIESLKRIGRLTKDVKLRLFDNYVFFWDLKNLTCYSHPAFVFRRWLIVLYPMVFGRQSGIPALLMLNLMNTAIYLHTKPHLGMRYKIELFNEISFMIFTSTLILITDYIPSLNF
jgi:hypothetical protein